MIEQNNSTNKTEAMIKAIQASLMSCNHFESNTVSNLTLTRSEFYQQLCQSKTKLLNRILNHPILQLISDLDNAQFFVGQYLHFAADIARITGLRYGLCRDEEVRRNLLSVMIEEDGYYKGAKFSRPSHYTLAKISAKSIGVDSLPEIHHGTLTLMNALEMQYSSSLLAGLASSYAREGMYPELMPLISTQLKKACPDADTVFFDVHGVADVEHAEEALECLIQLCSDSDLPKVKSSVHLGLAVFLTWYDAMYLELINF